MTKIAIDLIPDEIKNAYLDPVFDYAYELAIYEIDDIKNIVERAGNVIDCFISDHMDWDGVL